MGLIPITCGPLPPRAGRKPCGFLHSVEGGGVKGEVVDRASGHRALPEEAPREREPGADRAHLRARARAGGLRLAGGRLERDSDAARRQDRLHRRHASRRPRRIEFRGAVVTSVTFPKLDGSSKDAGRLTVVLEPEETSIQKALGEARRDDRDQGASSGSRPTFASRSTVSTAKQVAKVDGFTVVTTGRAHRLSRPPCLDRRVRRRPLGVRGTRSSWSTGTSDEGSEKSGALVLMDATLQEIGRVALAGLGIHRLAREKAEADAEAVARVVAELYCERMELAL